jgi:hypothetical protein
MNVKEMSDADLEAASADLHKQHSELRGRIRAVTAELSQRSNVAQAKRLLATMGDPQRRALLQVIKAEGIKSEEAVGIPGGS